MFKSPFERLFKFTLNELPVKLKLRSNSELVKTPGVWEALSNHFFNQTPLASDNPEQFFWHCYNLFHGSFTLHDNEFKIALNFEHFEALQRAAFYYLDQNEFETARH